jgi:PAS domain S-box-containing protein
MSTSAASDPASTGSHAALLAELAAALAGAASLDELCDRAVDAVRAFLGTDRASVLLFDQDGVMRFRAWNGLSDEYRAATDGHSPWAPETRDAEPIVVSNVADDPALAALRDVILREHIQALAFVPITYAGRLLGKYMLYFDQPRRLTEDELLLAGAVADQIAVAVEQHRVAHELQASHEQLEVIFRGVGEGVTVQRPDGTLVYANDAAAHGLGFSSPEELLAAPVTTILAPFEVLTEAGEPFPMDELPGRRVLLGEEDQAEAVLRYRRRDTGEESYAHVRATSVRDAEGNVLYAVNLLRDVSKSRRRDEWQRFLADSGEILNTSLDYETTASQLARLVVPRLADWCVVHVADEGGLRQIAIEHADPARVEWAREMQERYPPDADAETGVPNVVRSGRAELYVEITDEMLQQAARDETHLELLRRLGLTSAMIVPLAARDRVFGALTFVSESGRRYGEDDLVQAEDLARHAALAMDNARLHHEAQQARRDAELAASVSARLHSVTASLARAATADDVARVAVDEGAAALEADAAAVFVHDQHRREFVTLAHTGYPRDLGVEHASFSTSEDNPVTEALRTRASVVVTSGEELVARWPALAGDQGATGDEATVAQPILSGEAVVGVLHVAFRSPRRFRDWELAFIETLASQTGQALARARAYDRDHEAAVALQQTLLPTALPSADGIALGAHYVPARYEANVGGDWYDALLLSDGTLAVCVGDVVGHGLAAATAMGQLRNAIRAYLLEDLSPGQVLGRLNRYARSIGEGAFSTTVVATVDPARETWRFAGAGHPPPLVLTEGNLRMLELTGPPIGSLDDFDYEHVEAVVTRPSFVILYTDGLVERRGARIEDGLARLLEVATESIASGSADAEALVERMLGGEGPADDVAVLVVESLGTRPLALELAAEPSQLVVLRDELRPWLRSYGLDEATCHEVLVATGEAAANAIEHPHDPQSTVFRVECHVDADELVIRIFDSGRWREQSLPTDRGRGLFFMRELMSDVEIRERDEGTEVVLRRGLRSRGHD